jgi:hypothetical protein
MITVEEFSNQLSSSLLVSSPRNTVGAFMTENRSHRVERAPAESLSMLKAEGVKTTVFGAKETNHRKLNDNLGTTDDPATKVLQKFVDACLAE